MRSFRLALIGLFIVAGALGCAEADPWVGEWSGTMTMDFFDDGLVLPEQTILAVIALERGDDESLVATCSFLVPKKTTPLVMSCDVFEFKDLIRIRFAGAKGERMLDLRRTEDDVLEGSVFFEEGMDAAIWVRLTRSR